MNLRTTTSGLALVGGAAILEEQRMAEKQPTNVKVKLIRGVRWANAHGKVEGHAKGKVLTVTEGQARYLVKCNKAERVNGKTAGEEKPKGGK